GGQGQQGPTGYKYMLRPVLFFLPCSLSPSCCSAFLAYKKLILKKFNNTLLCVISQLFKPHVPSSYLLAHISRMEYLPNYTHLACASDATCMPIDNNLNWSKLRHHTPKPRHIRRKPTEKLAGAVDIHVAVSNNAAS